MCYGIHEVYSSQLRGSYLALVLAYQYAEERCSLVMVVVTDQ